MENYSRLPSLPLTCMVCGKDSRQPSHSGLNCSLESYGDLIKKMKAAGELTDEKKAEIKKFLDPIADKLLKQSEKLRGKNESY